MILYATRLDGITVERLDRVLGRLAGGSTPALHRAMLEGGEAFVLAIDEAAGGRVVDFANVVGDGVLAANDRIRRSGTSLSTRA